MNPVDLGTGDQPTASEVRGAGRTHPDGGPGDEKAPNFSVGQAAQGGLWTLVTFGMSLVLRFGSSLVMTRLLLPEAFGLMALVWSVLQGLNLFSDLGIGANMVQHPRGAEPRFRNTAWTIQVLRGVMICTVAVAAAPIVAAFYPDYTGLEHLIQAAALTALIDGFASMSIYVMGREMRVARLSLLDLGTQTLSLTTMIVWATYDPTPWAMIAGALVSGSTKTLASHLLFGGDRPAWDSPSVAAIVRFGKWALVSTLLLFLAGQADRLIFGRLIPAGMLGVYSLGLQLASLASDLVMRLGGSVLFPVLCRTVQRGEHLLPVFIRYRRPILLLGGWGLAGTSGGGNAIIEFLYRSEYGSAGWILQLLAAGFWFGHVLQGTRGSALIAMGMPRLTSFVSGAKLVGMVILIPIGFHFAEFPGAVAGYTMAELLRYATSAWLGHRMGLGALGDDTRLTCWFLGSALAGWGSVSWLQALGAAAWVQCVGDFLIVTALWLPLMLPYRRQIREILATRT